MRIFHGVERFAAVPASRVAVKVTTTMKDASGDTDSSPGSADDGGSSLGDGFFGFGEGDMPPPPDAMPDAGDDEGGGSSGTANQPPLCTPLRRKRRRLLKIKARLVAFGMSFAALAADAYEFVRGFWEGLRDQIGDLVAAITDPIETARAFMSWRCPSWRTPSAPPHHRCGAGHDLSQLIECDAFDRGRVLGSYVSPAFMLKLAAKLARFGRVGLRAAADATKRELGCASFAADTSVWSGDRGVPIRSLEPGEWVDARSDRDYLDQSRLVTHVFERRASAYHVVETEASRFAVTEEHPLVGAGPRLDRRSRHRSRRAGSPLRAATHWCSQNRRVDAPLRGFQSSPSPMTQSYFVGDERVWAHNATLHSPRPLFASLAAPATSPVGSQRRRPRRLVLHHPPGYRRLSLPGASLPAHPAVLSTMFNGVNFSTATMRRPRCVVRCEALDAGVSVGG